MTTPTDPTHTSPRIPPTQPVNQQTPTMSSIDPSGIWSKFLSTSGTVATPEEVKMFMQGILKMFNVLIQQQNDAYKRANAELKKAAQGDD